MDAGAPVAQLLAVALAAQQVRALERHALAAREVQPVAVGRVVAVEAPAVLLVVAQLDVVVHLAQLAPRGVRLEAGVAAGAREDAVAERRRRQLEPLFRHRRDPAAPSAAVRRAIVATAATASARGSTRFMVTSAGQAYRCSTARCISRTHIVWNTCSRWPITAATFAVTMRPTSGWAEKCRASASRVKHAHLAGDGGGRVQGEAVRRDEPRPADRLAGLLLLDHDLLLAVADAQRQRERDPPALDGVDRVGRRSPCGTAARRGRGSGRYRARAGRRRPPRTGRGRAPAASWASWLS